MEVVDDIGVGDRGKRKKGGEGKDAGRGVQQSGVVKEKLPTFLTS